MISPISTKLAALGMALLMNSAILGGVAYLFNGPGAEPTVVAQMSQALTTTAFC